MWQEVILFNQHDMGKLWIIIQLIDVKSYCDEPYDLHPYTYRKQDPKILDHPFPNVAVISNYKTMFFNGQIHTNPDS